MNFGKDIKKITYAISACELDFGVYGNRIKELCDSLDYISFRERESIGVCEQIIKKKIALCPDPTFLVNVADYEAIFRQQKIELTDYILVYALEDGTDNESLLFKRVRELHNYYNKKIVVISGPHRWPYKVEQIRGLTPSEFLLYIKNAFCVICNSFHATVFSILYEKKFVTYEFKNRNIRMNELLSNIGLLNRTINKEEEIVAVMEQKIDYERVRIKIDDLKKSGHGFLNTALK